MAGGQPVRREQDEQHIDDWMADRNAHLGRVASGAYEAGRQRWSNSTRTGENASAARPSDVVALGAAHRTATAPSEALSPEMRELRRQQAEFKGVTRQLDRDNRWLAAATLAPIAVLGGPEGAIYGVAKEFLNPPGPPLQLPGKQPLLTKGDTYYTRYGRQQDFAFRNKVSPKTTGNLNRGLWTKVF